MIVDYILKFHLQDCLNILSEKDKLGYYCIKIDFLKLFETYPDVGDRVLCSPVESLPVCDKNIIKAQQNIIEQDEYKNILIKLDHCSLKINVHARFFGLPVCPELHRTIFPKNVDLGCFLKVTGTVVRVTQAKMLEYKRKYVCVKCKYENCTEAEFENRYVLRAPTKCGNIDPKCRCATFTQINLVSREHCKDYQEIKIQEQVNKLSIGTIPGSMWVVLEDDLVDSCKPGDDVNICGTVRRRWRPSVQNKKTEVDLVLQANYLEVCNAQRSEVIATASDVKECFNEYWSKFSACPLKGRDQILATVCPQVYGLHVVKLALLLTVITGSNHIIDQDVDKKLSQEEKHTIRVRGQCHMLLVGDPGTGKSQLLRAGAELTPRSVFTSGAGSTRAGLTCCALREEGEWQLEAGALVLSDGGVCCIDEISQLRDHDRTAIHEAMEQQTISIAKAGIVCKLNTRCAIIAACNPKGHYETDQPLSVNVSLGTPLLSRFDLIFILLDTKNKAWDKLVSSYILFGGNSTATNPKKQWTIEKLQMYIGLVGPKRTEMTKSANIILQTYYMTQRKSEHRDPSRTTVRMLDSLARLSQAHCRLMYRTTILPMDAIMAVSLVDLSMQDCTLEDTVNALHSTFQKYPDFEYLKTAKKLLTRLNLYEIWQEELLYYGKLLQVDHKTLQYEIENGNYCSFAKYDDVTDDNLPLSSSLVTSSYFNNKKDKQQHCEDLDAMNIHSKEHLNYDNIESKDVKDKLATTLKKHATLNKDIKNIPTNKVIKKRKRKEVTVDVTFVNTKRKRSLQRIKNKSESDEELSDTTALLNAVPSVNDVFNDLGIDFKFGNSNSCEDIESEGKDSKEINYKCGKQKDSKSFEIEICSDKINKESHTIHKTDCENKNSSKAINKLMQFQFVEKHNLNKIFEKITDNFSDVANSSKIKEKNNMEEKENTLLVKQNSSVSSSQISIFESSDCELDIDI